MSSENSINCPKDCIKKQLSYYLQGDTDIQVDHYLAIKEKHSFECRSEVAQTICELAMKGNMSAVRFWLVCYGGWRLPQENN